VRKEKTREKFSIATGVSHVNSYQSVVFVGGGRSACICLCLCVKLTVCVIHKRNRNYPVRLSPQGFLYSCVFLCNSPLLVTKGSPLFAQDKSLVSAPACLLHLVIRCVSVCIEIVTDL